MTLKKTGVLSQSVDMRCWDPDLPSIKEIREAFHNIDRAEENELKSQNDQQKRTN